VTENTQANGNPQNNALWLRYTHNFTEEDWRRIFVILSTDQNLKDEFDEKHFIPMKVYN